MYGEGELSVTSNLARLSIHGDVDMPRIYTIRILEIGVNLQSTPYSPCYQQH